METMHHNSTFSTESKPLLPIQTQKIPSLSEKNFQEFHTKNQEHTSEYTRLSIEHKTEINNYYNEDMESVRPKYLKIYTNEVANNVINHNHYTVKHINMERAKTAYQAIDFLLNKGIDINIAIGMVANGIAESGLETISKRSGLGIFQWIWPRAKKYHNMRHNLEWNTELEKQLNFALYEMNTTESATKVALQWVQTPEEAARVFLAKFERPKVNNFSERSAIATGLRQFAEI